jgi:hypothetical protein
MLDKRELNCFLCAVLDYLQLVWAELLQLIDLHL